MGHIFALYLLKCSIKRQSIVMFFICLLDSGEIMLYVTVKKLSRMMQWFLQICQ